MVWGLISSKEAKSDSLKSLFCKTRGSASLSEYVTVVQVSYTCMKEIAEFLRGYLWLICHKNLLRPMNMASIF